MRGQTPQGFKLDVIREAHERARRDGVRDAVDDCSLVLRYNLGPIHVVLGDVSNIKLTYIEDLYLAERLFQLRTLGLWDLGVSPKDISKKLYGRVIVVFGGSRGIGHEICRLARESGAIVYSFSRANNVDVTDYNAVQSALLDVHEKQGRIDVVVCTAGILKIGTLERCNIEDIVEQIKVNLLGSIHVGKASIPFLKETGGAIIFFTSSSFSRGRENYAAYSAAKAAIVNFTQALSDELSYSGVRVNAICPERTNTPMRRQNFGNEPKDSLLSPRTVAYVTLLTACSKVTGQVIDVRKEDEKRIPQVG